jgi:hypothetical protein
MTEPRIITEIKKKQSTKGSKMDETRAPSDQQELVVDPINDPIIKVDQQPQSIESAIIALVQRADIDPERLEKFLDMQERMENRQADKALTAALSGFQRDCPIINKTKKAHNSNYAPLDEIVHAIKPVMAKHGLSYSFNTKKTGADTSLITTIIRHIEGGIYQSEYEYLSADDGGKMNSAQKLKSALTYARRAALELALGLVTQEEDDDAKRAVDIPLTGEQMQTIQELCNATDTTEGKLLSFLRIESLGDLSKVEADNAIRNLKHKRKVLTTKQELK